MEGDITTLDLGVNDYEVSGESGDVSGQASSDNILTTLFPDCCGKMEEKIPTDRRNSAAAETVAAVPASPPAVCASSPSVSSSSTTPRHNEIASLDIPPRSCRSSQQLSSSSIQLAPHSMALPMETQHNSVTIATSCSDNINGPASYSSTSASCPSTPSADLELQNKSIFPSSLSSVTLPSAIGTHQAGVRTCAGAPVHDCGPNSITIKIYRPPIYIGAMNTLITDSNRKNKRCGSPGLTLNGGACLSLVRPALQAQECSSDDLKVTVPPIRSEVMLNVSNFNAPVSSMAANQMTSPQCPRPVQGPTQSEPSSAASSSSSASASPASGEAKRNGSKSENDSLEGEGGGSDGGAAAATSTSPTVSKLAHCNIPRVKPRWKSVTSTQISPRTTTPPAATTASTHPEATAVEAPNTVHPSLIHRENSLEKPELNGLPESPLNSLTSDKSNSLSSDSSSASNISVICTTSIAKATVLSPVVDTEKGQPEEPVPQAGDIGTKTSKSHEAKSNEAPKCETSAPSSMPPQNGPLRPEADPSGNGQEEHFALSNDTGTNNIPLSTAAECELANCTGEFSAIDLEGPIVKLTPRQAFFIRGPISPQPLQPTSPENSPSIKGAISPSQSSSSLVSSASCSSLTHKLPPRPPSIKKQLCLSPLQQQQQNCGSSSATTSPTGPTPPSYMSSSRRSLGAGGAGGGVNCGGGGGLSGGKPGHSRVLPPLQMYMFTRRPSVSSQESAPGCLTPTHPTPPSNLPLGRFPNMAPYSNQGVPPMYHQHTSSPVTSPYSESPSNSRPPSWYGYRQYFRGRDSSPSATSRDSLDSFIRPPPSGIFSSRNSTGNLLASRSSMDNLSDTSGDSVFDDIMSESEKKSLDDTAESVGSLGSSLNIVETDVNGSCGHIVAAPDGAAYQGRTAPSGGRMSKQASFDMPPVHEVPGGGGGGGGGGEVLVTSPSSSSVVTPGVASLGQQSIISQPQQPGPVQLQSVGPEPPPSYEEAIGLVPEGASSSHLLTYKDFVPIQDPQRRSWEPFNKVVLRANEWLVSNPDVRISSCESVLGLSAQSDGFNPDRSVATRSQIITESTYYLRFLRIWYSRLDQTSTDIEPQQVRYANFISATDNASISTLVELINSKLNCAIHGDILNVETLYILRKAVRCPDTSCWREQPCDTKSYSFFLRVFWLEPQEERQHHISLGFMDIVPQHAAGKNYPHDYEPFAVLVQVAQWWARQKADPGTHIINVQSLYVKQKALCTFWQRLHYTESAGGSNSFKYTMYNQILRIYYQTPISSMGIQISPSIQISYRTFTPVQLTSPTDPCLKFESFGETVNRVLHWLKLSGAQLLSIETIKIRMYGGLQGPHGAECTLLRSEGRKYCDREHWLHCIRVYFVGEYQEPDSSRIPSIPHVVPYFTTSPRPIAFLAPTIAFS